MPKPLPCSAAELDALAETHGTPLQLYDEAGICEQTRGMIDAFAASFPGFKEFFAVKALPNPAILQVCACLQRWRSGGGGGDLQCTAALLHAIHDALPSHRVETALTQPHRHYPSCSSTKAAALTALPPRSCTSRARCVCCCTIAGVPVRASGARACQCLPAFEPAACCECSSPRCSTYEVRANVLACACVCLLVCVLTCSCPVLFHS